MSRTLLAVPLLALLAACGGREMTPPSQPPPAQTQPPPVTTGVVSVKNSTEQTIWYVYLSPASASQWGVDQLKSNVLAPGAIFDITSVPAGRYDLKVVTETGATGYVWAFTVTAGSTVRVTFN